MLKITTFAALLFWLLGGLSAAIAADRYALIIGNGDYRNVAALKNPVNDARDMEAILDDLNFETRLVENTELADVERAVAAFLRDLDRGRFYCFRFKTVDLDIDSGSVAITGAENATGRASVSGSKALTTFTLGMGF